MGLCLNVSSLTAATQGIRTTDELCSPVEPPLWDPLPPTSAPPDTNRVVEFVVCVKVVEHGLDQSQHVLVSAVWDGEGRLLVVSAVWDGEGRLLVVSAVWDGEGRLLVVSAVWDGEGRLLGFILRWLATHILEVMYVIFSDVT